MRTRNNAYVHGRAHERAHVRIDARQCRKRAVCVPLASPAGLSTEAPCRRACLWFVAMRSTRRQGAALRPLSSRAKMSFPPAATLTLRWCWGRSAVAALRPQARALRQERR
jgi:hypothetical protein